MSNVREVLVVYKGRKRPVVLPNVENTEQINLLNLAKEAFSDLIYCQEGSSDDCTTADPKFYLQMESTKWGGQLIEVTTAALQVFLMVMNCIFVMSSNLKQAAQW